MACNDRQLSQAQREAGFQQQRTGVVRALRPFGGSPTLENLIDYINRELGPALRAAREAVNDTYLQVADNAPSANPLAFYFATAVTGGDPTTGRVKLNASPQNTATVIRVSQTNGRLVDVTPWLDVMSGGVTTPLGVVTLVDAINPGRFLRFDLNSMTDQGVYWDLAVTFIEGSDADPFVDEEAVTVGFIASVAAAGATIPVSAISPIANDTFIGNVSGATAAPSAVNLSTLAGAGLAFAAHTLDVTGSTSITITSDQVQRAALTGAVAASANSNATVFAGIRDNGSAENDRTNLNFLSSTSCTATVTDDSGNDELEITIQRAALSGAITASANANTTVFSGIRDNGGSENDRSNLNFIDSTSVSASVADDAGNDELEISFLRAALTGEVTAGANSNATTVVRSTDFDTSPWTGNHQFDGQVALGTITTSSSTGSINITLGASATRLNLSGSGAITLGTVSGCADGRVLVVEFSNTGTHTISHDSSAADAFACPNNTDLVIDGRGGFIAVGRLGTNNNWKIVAVSKHAESRMIKRHTLQSSDASITITPDGKTAWLRCQILGAGGGGGGADAGEDESAAGGGGGAGAYGDFILPIVSGNITGAVAAGGTAGSNAGGDGGDGGDTTLTYNGTTYTAGGGGGGVGITEGNGASVTGDTIVRGGGGSGGAIGSLPTGSIGATGGDGFPGWAYGNAEVGASAPGSAAIGGTGGASFFGGGAAGGTIAGAAGTSNGSSGTAPGSGGGGGARISSASAVTGATGSAGKAGAMVVEEWSGPVPTLASIS